MLLSLQERPVEFVRLYEALGARQEAASAEELSHVASQLGLDLETVVLENRDLDRLQGPWIAFFQNCAGTENGIGHFVVVRGISDNTKLQIIDPPRPPRVIDRASLFRENGWCRIALIPKRVRRLQFLPFIGLGAIGLILFVTRQHAITQFRRALTRVPSLR